MTLFFQIFLSKARPLNNNADLDAGYKFLVFFFIIPWCSVKVNSSIKSSWQSFTDSSTTSDINHQSGSVQIFGEIKKKISLRGNWDFESIVVIIACMPRISWKGVDSYEQNKRPDCFYTPFIYMALLIMFLTVFLPY